MKHLEKPVSVNRLLNAILFTALTTLVLGSSINPALGDTNPKPTEYSAYLMAYFTDYVDDPSPDRAYGLRYAYSKDARNWKALNNGKPVFDAKAYLRDPFVNRVKGKFHMVHTKGMEYPTIFHWESTDLINWKGGEIDVVHPSGNKAWAPEFFYVESEDLFYVYWASNYEDLHTMHYVTTKDWTDITPDRSDIFYNIGMHDIDLTIVEHDGTYYGFHKPGAAEALMGNRLSVSRSLKPGEVTFGQDGPGKVVFPDSHPGGTEGPEVIKLIGRDKWYIYGDPFAAPLEAWETVDFVNYTKIDVTTPQGAKHCSMIPITQKELDMLLEKYPNDDNAVSQAFAEEDVYWGVSRELALDEKYIIFPVADETNEDDSEVQVLELEVDGEKVREFKIRLAPGEPAYWFFTETHEFRGKRATLRTLRITEKELDSFFAIRVDNTFPGEDEVYTEKLRPQLHFSSRRGWNNDPNGMMYYKGEFHLFYQHNPYSALGGNMTWGHAVSKDLLHWEELGDAIHLDQYGTIFSGSGVVDWNNTTGFQTGDEAPLICIFTYSGECDAGPWSEGQPFTQGIAYSNDRGRTWTKYEGNPVQGRVKGNNRDPKVIWWEETKEWVIILWLDTGEMAFFRSKDLKRWELQSIFESGKANECAELFQLPVDGDENNKKWIFYGGTGDYFIGDFDGSVYTPEGEQTRYSYGNCFYASQTFNNVPKEDGRRIQIGWGLNHAPGMPFDQMMTFPVVLTLHTTADGLRMFPNPVEEIAKLYKKEHEWTDLAIPADESVPAPGLEGELFDIDVVLDVGDAEEVGLSVRGEDIVYNPKEEQLSFGELEAPLKARDGSIRLRCIADRTSVEIFANGGHIYMPCKLRADGNNKRIAAFARGGSAAATSVKIRELESIWEK